MMATQRRIHLVLVAALTLALLIYTQLPERRTHAAPTIPEIFNQTLGFQEIFVVNLPERTDRRDAMVLMGAASGLRLTFADGVRGADVLEKTLPVSGKTRTLSPGKVGSWRAHMNVLQRIVQEDITTALIMEDDVDWDVQIKPQFRRFADASRLFLQPLDDDPPTPLSQRHPPSKGAAKEPPAISVLDAPQILDPKTSPYGDDWDVLWLGHTGGEMPVDWKSLKSNNDTPPRSLLTVTIPDDETVPAPEHIKRHPWARKTERFSELFPPHTRVVHEPRGTGGVQAYAVSQRGARRLLRQFGLETFTELWDVSLRDFCEGVFAGGEEGPVCLTTQPPLVAQYWSRGDSDIGNIGGGYFHKTGSINIRYSVRLNLKRLVGTPVGVEGDVEGLVDQWPDDGKGPW